jgi:Tol biopolymer transport system component
MQNIIKSNRGSVAPFFRSFSFFISFSFLLSSCRGPSLKVGETLNTPKGYELPTVQQLIESGSNRRARFSPDGTRIIFIGSERIRHKQPQVYEFDLKTKMERRVTFQDGEIIDVAYASPDEILYSSTTDEIKENPDFIKLALKQKGEEKKLNGYGEPLPMSEIYTSSIEGRNIQRLTQQSGFDGEIAPGPKHEACFVSMRNNRRQIFTLNTRSKEPGLLNLGPEEFDGPSYSPNNKELIYIRYIEERAEIWRASIRGTDPKSIISDSSLNLEPIWHPNNEDILFVSNRDDIKNFEIYAAKSDGTCIRRLTYNSAIDRSPDVSPDGKKLLFTSNRSGKWQIYITDYNPPPCPTAQLQLESK